MRVGDTYKIKSMVANGCTQEEILERFKNDYPADEIVRFIPKDVSTGESVQKEDEKEAAEEKPDEKKAAEKKGFGAKIKDVLG